MVKTKEELQLLAKSLFNIDWVAVQCDHQHECASVQYILMELEDMNPKQALRLVLKVMEAKQCLQLPDVLGFSPFKDMDQFDYIDQEINYYSTDELRREFQELQNHLEGK